MQQQRSLELDVRVYATFRLVGAQQTNPGFTPGIRVGSIRDGKVTAFIPEPAAEPSQEGVAADAAGNIYGSLTGGMALRKYAKK